MSFCGSMRRVPRGISLAGVALAEMDGVPLRRAPDVPEEVVLSAAAAYRHEQVDGCCQEEPEGRRRVRIERLLRRGKGLGSFPRSFRIPR